MKVHYDQAADALYITLADADTVDRSVPIDEGTLVDTDRHGRPVGIEIIHPGRQWPLGAILQRFALSDQDERLLRELGGEMSGAPRRPFVPPVQVAS